MLSNRQPIACLILTGFEQSWKHSVLNKQTL